MRDIFLERRPPPVTSGSAPMFTSRLRTDAEKIPLRAICEQCEFNRSGQCVANKCCGGRVAIETLLNLDTTHCPRRLWHVDNAGVAWVTNSP